ncbi:hypothetical protein PHYPSEUDO_000165 [Phytophthora pseudosyringae]|uniref:tRNA (guanine(9)-N(1))-methyltransferase n=1 Tax=Phytophthora pseudosyringae TaxID=221518 RepID=A0A8T1WFD5_9STRA|nr:hypothetical protein PHYPSEUDO_000165 [Phytophthora pseudosyringae]
MRPLTVAVGLVLVTTCWALGRYGLQRWSRREKATKQSRRELTRSKRRNRKDERLKAKKLERSRALAAERAEMTAQQKNEQRERIRMQRVEQFQKLAEAQLSGVRVVVDLAFAADQTNRVCISCGAARELLLTTLFLLLALHLVSCTPELAPICMQHGALSWKIGRHEEPLEQIYDAHELVYLSPDSETVLEHLDPGCVYVVGGIVDRSVRKGETKTKAASRGIRTARLPLQEHSEQSGTRVRTHILNLDSVIIVLNEVANHGDWGRAFQRAVPPRISRTKGHKSKAGSKTAAQEETQ